MAVAAAKEAAATNESLKVSTFYRGACSINPIEFKQRGGTEVGFLSMSKSRTVAQVQAFHCLAAANKLDEAATAAQDLQEEEPVVDEEEEEEIVYLPLASRPSVDGGGTGGGPKMSKDEIPILLFRFTPAEDQVPADLSFLSPLPDDGECVYPLGMYLEQRKETTEFATVPNTNNESYQCKIVDVATHYTRAGMIKAPGQSKKEAQAAKEERAEKAERA